MAFTTTNGVTNDAMSGLINALSDPDRISEALKELQEATQLNEASVERLRKESSGLEVKRNQVTLEYAKLEGIKREIKKELSDAQTLNLSLETKYKDLENSLKDLENARKDVRDQKLEVADEKSKFDLYSNSQKADLEERRKQHILKERQIDELSRQLNLRELSLKTREDEASLLIETYTAKLNKLRELLT